MTPSALWILGATLRIRPVGWRDNRAVLVRRGFPPPGQREQQLKPLTPGSSADEGAQLQQPAARRAATFAIAARQHCSSRVRDTAERPPAGRVVAAARMATREGRDAACPSGQYPSTAHDPPTDHATPTATRTGTRRGRGRVATPARGRGQLNCQEQRGGLPGAPRACVPTRRRSPVRAGCPRRRPGIVTVRRRARRRVPVAQRPRRTPVRARLGGEHDAEPHGDEADRSVRPAASRPRARTDPAP